LNKKHVRHKKVIIKKLLDQILSDVNITLGVQVDPKRNVRNIIRTIKNGTL